MIKLFCHDTKKQALRWEGLPVYLCCYYITVQTLHQERFFIRFVVCIIVIMWRKYITATVARKIYLNIYFGG